MAVLTAPEVVRRYQPRGAAAQLFKERGPEVALAGPAGCVAGETLLWASPDVNAKRALQMWLESPEHRRILLTPAWREIGLSAVHTMAGPRVFDSLEVTIVTADFGARVR